MVENKDVNFLDKLIKDDMFNFYMGTVISADTLVDLDSCEKALKSVIKLKNAIPDSKLKTDRIVKLINDAEEIIIRDMNLYK